MTVIVEQQHFHKITGYQPTEGKKGKIRFRLYDQGSLNLTKNKTQGLVLQPDIDAAASDELALKTGNFAFVSSVALGTKRLNEKFLPVSYTQGYAIRLLGSGRFPKEEVLKVLDQIIAEIPKHKSLAQTLRKNVENGKFSGE